MALWGKKTGDLEPPAPSISDARDAPEAASSVTEKEKPMAMLKKEEELPRTSGEVNAVLGRGTEFEGKLTFEGEVRIAGKFTGEIFSKDRLQIDDSARIKAEITTGSLVVYGEITGNIRATQLVELKASARVKGNIEAPSLVIERGVIFEGSCKMENLGKGATVTALPKADEKDKK
ncbi:MAG: bactofilin family protein [Myxococcales bacterium]|jgi:cytoskeletal protein CcmA (bactofilin family)